jgi:hypothetical protein
LSADETVKIWAIDEFTRDGFLTENGVILTDENNKPNRKSDPWTKQYDQLEMFNRYCGHFDRVTALKGRCPDEVVSPDSDIDLLVISDVEFPNNELSVWRMIEAHLPMLKPNAAIGSHSIGDPRPGYHETASSIVTKLETVFNTKATYYPDSTLWMIQKTS